MKKFLLFSFLFVTIAKQSFSQADRFWSVSSKIPGNIVTDKAVARISFPSEFRLFDLSLSSIKQELFSAINQPSKNKAIISLPNADGGIEQFEAYEASNFEPALQAKFPEIRAFSGRGVTDRYATLKLSISPQGIQAMIFRTEKENEFIEPYSQDHTVYAVFKSKREKNKLPWTCTTDDKTFDAGIKNQLPQTNGVTSSAGELKTMRLAQSVTAEYSNYFGATSAAQVGLVLAAVNATLTRCNGCYEKDLALHLNLILASTNVFYYDPNTDPYSPGAVGAGGAWNGELQSTLTSVIGEANYDIGHLFGASGGGGNAGCIGCVCVNGSKGSGFTSPADNIPQGDNFDIDYVVHEVGHQLGANHTFSMSLEGTGRNKEVGSGITIMGYAGITSQDVAPHSIDIYHETSIEQIQANLAIKLCPVTTNITVNNATPVVAPLTNYTIPISTPFALTGSATDANNDPLTYCWEQNDNSTVSGANSVASPTKASGPNWLSFSPVASPTRLFPTLATILAGLDVTGPLPGGDPGTNIEALSSISRTLNFRLTVRDNHPYSSTPPIAVGQTAYSDMVVTVTNTAGPFKVTSPNTNVGWCDGSTQTITWDVNGTDGGIINCANVKISLSTDGGLTFPIVLFASTPNDGSETFVVPANFTSTARIKIESIGNIFFDICDSDFNIVSSQPIVVTAQPATATVCNNGTTTFTVATTGSSLSYQWQESADGITYNDITNGGIYSGATTATLKLTGVTFAINNYKYRCNITNACNPVTTSNGALLIINAATAFTTQVTNTSACLGSNATFTIAATGSGTLTYQWQESVNGGSTWTAITNGGIYSGATTTALTLTGVTAGMNTYRYRCVVSSSLCAPPVNSSAAILTIGNALLINTQPVNAVICDGGNASYSITATNANSYQWQLSTDGGVTYTNLANAGIYSNTTTATLNITGVTVAMNNYRYRCIALGICPSVNSNSALLTVNIPPVLNIQPPASVAVCNGQGTSLGLTAAGTSLNYQWQLSTDGGVTYNNLTNAGIYSNVTAASMSITSTTTGMNNYRYRCLISGACTPAVTSNAVILTVNTAVVVTNNPANYILCENSNASFKVTATGSSPTYQWQVSTNGGSTFTDVINGGIYSGAATSVLSLSGVTASLNNNQYRCIVMGATSCGNVTSTAATLFVNAAPAPFTVTGGGSYCSGNGGVPVGLSGSSGGIYYQLQLNGVNVGSYLAGTGSPLNFGNKTAPGTYTVFAANSTTGCTKQMPGSVVVDVFPAPVVSLSAAPYQKLFPGLTTTLTATVTNSTATPFSYMWFKNNTLLSGIAVNPVSVNISSLGDYRVVITDGNGCTAQSSTVTIGDSANSKLFIYPNPNNGIFTVTYYSNASLFAPTKQGITIYDRQGKQVYNNIFEVTRAYQMHQVDLRNYSTGLYYVVIRDENGKAIQTQPVLIVR